MTTTFSIDGFILGGLALIMIWYLFRWIEKRIENDNLVNETREQIHSQALWEYENKYNKWKEEEKMPKEETFNQKLEKETKEHFFKKRENKKK